jgi:diazepam-binding inhibitor (GABA receptor modulator, acyl-CoA-binding protein)
MDNQKLFEEAVLASKQLSPQSNENLLRLYSLYKQATEGDLNIEKPSNIFDMVGMAKYNAWSQLVGITKEDAMQRYVDLVERLKVGA